MFLYKGSTNKSDKILTHMIFHICACWSILKVHREWKWRSDGETGVSALPFCCLIPLDFGDKAGTLRSASGRLIYSQPVLKNHWLIHSDWCVAIKASQWSSCQRQALHEQTGHSDLSPSEEWEHLCLSLNQQNLLITPLPNLISVMNPPNNCMIYNSLSTITVPIIKLKFFCMKCSYTVWISHTQRYILPLCLPRTRSTDSLWLCFEQEK